MMRLSLFLLLTIWALPVQVIAEPATVDPSQFNQRNQPQAYRQKPRTYTRTISGKPIFTSVDVVDGALVEIPREIPTAIDVEQYSESGRIVQWPSTGKYFEVEGQQAFPVEPMSQQEIQQYSGQERVEIERPAPNNKSVKTLWRRASNPKFWRTTHNKDQIARIEQGHDFTQDPNPDPPPPRKKDPLGLDLDGFVGEDVPELGFYRGILISNPLLLNQQVWFDMDRVKTRLPGKRVDDYFSELTNWLMSHTKQGKYDAFLARDRNSNGLIDHAGELYGVNNQNLDPGKGINNGFNVLAREDGDKNNKKDGFIDENDKVWGELLLWFDRKELGTTNDTELVKLKDFRLKVPSEGIELGVKRISLNYSIDENMVDEYGNMWKEYAEFEYQAYDMESGQKVDVGGRVVSNVYNAWFAAIDFDRQNSK